MRRTSETSATGAESPDIARRAPTPRHSSCPTAATTNAAKLNISSAGIEPVTPSAISSTATPAPTPTGSAKLRFRFAAVARRHAISGPIPESSTSTSASGVM